jgi:serine/threonine-protein kinase
VALEGGPSTREIAGKPEYLAPEQIRGGSIDGRADLYSLGCVVYECLTGEPPFVGASEIAVIGGHLSRQPQPIHDRRPELPDALDAVFSRVLAKDPVDRYENCSAFVAAARGAVEADASAPA